jgi:hypothetical protein
MSPFTIQLDGIAFNPSDPTTALRSYRPVAA